ncbi:hypothetical protein [Lysinibacillus fusiformis]|uniref:Uncharacterized protein n=1 Tax=Lysinibacillus fusiformis TaxID=28031 RepID=A0A1E4R4S1_9BACI|nr:hypothetical protein [Lysinibacillus fusiformis]ODV55466.1 hypothetical protein BG258_05895 [Lysinibacillus fusiformis]
MPLNVQYIADTVVLNRDPKEVYKEVFENIGHYFSENAERLSANTVDAHAGMKIEIDIPISDIVTITTKITEYVTKTQSEVK